MSDLKAIHEHWQVDVYTNGMRILSIESSMLSGLNDLSEKDINTIEYCGNQLLSFAGNNTRQAIKDRLVEAIEKLSGFIMTDDYEAVISGNPTLLKKSDVIEVINCILDE